MKYPTTSKTLLGKLQSGDAISWDEFYRRYRGIVVAAGKFKGLSDAECEDLMQEVMIRFFKNASTFVFDPSIARFRTYLGKIVTGKIYDTLKSRRNHLPITEPGLENTLPADDGFEQRFEQEWQKLMLEEAEIRLKAKVDARTFLAYQLFAVQNRPLAEVAAGLKLTANQIYLAKSRCLKHLRSIVEELKDGEHQGGPGDEI